MNAQKCLCTSDKFQDLQDIDDKYSMPRGPLFLSPKTVLETVSENFNEGPADQKMRTLNSLLSLFQEGAKIVDGAYGNTDTDEEAYREGQAGPIQGDCGGRGLWLGIH